MKISVTWNNSEKTVILYTYSEGWEWNDYFNATTTALNMLSSVKHPVHTIMDFRNANMIPKGAITQMRRAVSDEPVSNSGYIVIVGANRLIKSMKNVGEKLVPKYFEKWSLEFVDTMSEADLLLQNLENTDVN